MRKAKYYIFLSFIFLGCRQENEVPHWPLSSNELLFPARGITFDWNPQEKYQAILYSFSQPIELPASIRNGKLEIDLTQVTGITEGPAELLLLGHRSYYFPLEIKNKKPDHFNTKTFYSPRAFDPDSSLIQQRLFVNIDPYRNLYPFTSTDYFKEINYVVSSKAGTYCPEENNPISCYYVNPGTCTSIPVKINKESDSLLQVEAGPLVDRYNNLIANGTLAQFILTEDNYISIGEVLVQKGYARMQYTKRDGSNRKVVIKIGDRSSKTTALNTVL